MPTVALRSSLTLYCYTLPSGGATPPVVVPYADEVEALQFTSVSPGGCGVLQAKLRLRDARLPRPELAPFARVALMDAGVCRFIGEIGESEYGLSDTDGEYVNLSCLGLGATLRDDTNAGVAYTAQTPLQIVTAQFTTRSAYLPIDSDLSAVFPDNPAVSLSPAYAGRTMEDVIADVALLAGDYAWGTWPHPQNRDVADFPTGQLQIHVRDTTTVSYTASPMLGDVYAWRITPSLERAYNAIQIGFVDFTQTKPAGTVLYADPRLNSDGTQGSAPFRRRKYYRDLSGVSTATKAQALALATAYGAEFQNLSSKIEVTLNVVRDANGNPIPPWSVQADANIYIPELAARAQQIATGAVAGTNSFYILEAKYTEDASGRQQVVLQCDNWVDRANQRIARLQLMADTLARLGDKSTAPVQAGGAPISGQCGAQFQATGAGQVFMVDVTFGTTASSTPTSITLAPISSVNATGAGVSNPSTQGFTLFWTSSGAGACAYHATYTTVGNCLLDVDAARGTFAHHCDGCDLTRRGLRLRDDLNVHRLGTDDQGREHAGLTVECPCGRVECFNTTLTEAEEDPTHGGWHNDHRAGQARWIRAAMRHEHVGLAHLVRP